MIVIFHIKYLVLYQYCLKIFEYDTLLVSLKSFVDDRIIAKKKKKKENFLTFRLYSSDSVA